MNEQQIAPTSAAGPIAKSEITKATPAILAGFAEKFSDLEKLAVRRSTTTAQWLKKQPLLSRLDQIETARHLNKFLPPEEILREQEEKFKRGTYTRATEHERRLIAMCLIDGIPHASATASAGYIETLVCSIEHFDDDAIDEWSPGDGFSIPVLYVATRRLIARSRFLPSVCEFIDASREARTQFWLAARATEQLLKLRWSAEDIIQLVDNPDDDAEDDDNPLPF